MQCSDFLSSSTSALSNLLWGGVSEALWTHNWSVRGASGLGNSLGGAFEAGETQPFICGVYAKQDGWSRNCVALHPVGVETAQTQRTKEERKLVGIKRRRAWLLWGAAALPLGGLGSAERAGLPLCHLGSRQPLPFPLVWALPLEGREVLKPLSRRNSPAKPALPLKAGGGTKRVCVHQPVVLMGPGSWTPGWHLLLRAWEYRQ